MAPEARAAAAEGERSRRKIEVGVVTSNKMLKTITVRIPRLYQHARYGKFMRRYTVCKAHDERQEAAIGDTVRIMETRPLSATKRWRLLDVVARARRKGEQAEPARRSAPEPAPAGRGAPAPAAGRATR